jgi:TetR/AcrR family fatty acid metabolism transcriptional regulator
VTNERVLSSKQKAKRQSILQAAGRVFAELGYEHSSIRDIARAAGVADGTIYNYFRNKQDLVEALIAGLVAGLGQAESQALGLADPAGLEARVLARMERLHDHYEVLAAVLPVILGSAELRGRFREGFLAPVLGQLESEMGGGEAVLPARMLMATVLGFQVLQVLGDGPSREAWNEPSRIAGMWSAFIRQAGGRS